MTRWQWLVSQFLRKLWLRAAAYGLLGVFTAILAIGAQRFLPWQVADTIGADAVESILNIIASSMLAVTTFSLSAMTAAYSAATTSVTPRATRLLIEDRVTHGVLSTFIGSFLFSIVGIIVLKTGAYGPSGRAVLFVVTIGVVALIVFQLLRWIDHLTKLGRVGETTDRVEAATRAALQARLAEPYLGGAPLTSDARTIPAGAEVIRAGRIGYLQHIDMFALSDIAEARKGDIFVLCNPGAFVSLDTPLAWARFAVAAEGDDTARDAFTIGAQRNFDQDPRFGFAVMSEIASRALSPATNDPGTALDVIGRNTRLLALWAEGQDEVDDIAPEHPHVHVAPLADGDLFEDAFMLLARDGSGLVEVQLRLQKCLAALARLGPEAFREAARRQAALAMRRAEANLTFADDLERVRQEIPPSP